MTVLQFKEFIPGCKCVLEQVRHCTYNVTLRRVRVTTVVVEKQ